MIIALLASLLMQPPADTEWVPLGDGGAGERFLAIRSRENVNGNVRVWMRVVPPPTGQTREEFGLLSFQCSTGRMAILSFKTFGENRRVIDDEDFEDQDRLYRPIGRDTMYWQLDQMLCERNGAVAR